MTGQIWERLGKERGRQLLKVAWISVESFYWTGKREKGKSLLLFLANQLNCSTSLDCVWVVNGSHPLSSCWAGAGLCFACGYSWFPSAAYSTDLPWAEVQENKNAKGPDHGWACMCCRPSQETHGHWGLRMAIPAPLLGNQDYAWAELCPTLQAISLVSSQSPSQPLVSSLCLWACMPHHFAQLPREIIFVIYQQAACTFPGGNPVHLNYVPACFVLWKSLYLRLSTAEYMMLKLDGAVYILLISPTPCPAVNTTYSWRCGRASFQKYRSRVCLAEQAGWEMLCMAEGYKGNERIRAMLMWVLVVLTKTCLGFLLCREFSVMCPQGPFSSVLVCAEVQKNQFIVQIFFNWHFYFYCKLFFCHQNPEEGGSTQC